MLKVYQTEVDTVIFQTECY